MEEYVDLRQFMTHRDGGLPAENDLLGATGMNNFFLYRAKELQLLVSALGQGQLVPVAGLFDLRANNDNNVLFRRAFAYPTFEVYLQALEAAARSAAEEDWLETEVTRAAELISGPSRKTTVNSSRQRSFCAGRLVEAGCAAAVEFVLDQVADARRRR